MEDSFKKAKTPFEINWQIRELFSEAALASFWDEIDKKSLFAHKN